jgi:hypothetical protein
MRTEGERAIARLYSFIESHKLLRQEIYEKASITFIATLSPNSFPPVASNFQ